ncbi:unnamed protein product, partial [marine sediment metagenome]
SLINVSAPTVDGVIVGDSHSGAGGYAQFGEIHQSGATDQHQATMGIQVHELGHLIFGLPDLYDTDGSSDGIGRWGVMSGGSWGRSSSDTYSGETAVLPCAWTKYNRGWVAGNDGDGMESLTAAGDNSATSSNTVFRASTHNIPDEYFLVENRRPVGYDRGLERWYGTTFGGLAIFHIDDGQASNSNDNQRLVDVEEADGDSDNPLDKTDLWSPSTATLFNDSSVPNSDQYDSSPSDVSISNISPSATVTTADFSTADFQ